MLVRISESFTCAEISAAIETRTSHEVSFKLRLFQLRPFRQIRTFIPAHPNGANIQIWIEWGRHQGKKKNQYLPRNWRTVLRHAKFVRFVVLLLWTQCILSLLSHRNVRAANISFLSFRIHFMLSTSESNEPLSCMWNCYSKLCFAMKWS